MEILGCTFTVLQVVFIGFLGVSMVIQWFYYFVFYARTAFHKTATETGSGHPEPVSVIICARNEAQNLENHLPVILEQDYPDFEVIVVDDRSTDNTPEILERYKKKYPGLVTSRVNDDAKLVSSKKLAQTLGIKAAKNDLLVLTDADCAPVSSLWLRKMQAQFHLDTEIVLGYGGYRKRRGFLDKLIRYDTLFTAMQYLSFAKAGIPYMGVGRNLAYRKTLFLRNKGFASHSHIASGDDDLFINETARRKNTRICIDKESKTLSLPETTFSGWVKQKRRHLTTGKLYKPKHKFLLFLEPFSRVGFYASGIALLLILNYPLNLFAGAIFLFRTIIQQIIIKKNMNRLQESDLLLYSLPLDFILPWMIFIFSGINIFGLKETEWK